MRLLNEAPLLLLSQKKTLFLHKHLTDAFRHLSWIHIGIVISVSTTIISADILNSSNNRIRSVREKMHIIIDAGNDAAWAIQILPSSNEWLVK